MHNKKIATPLNQADLIGRKLEQNDGDNRKPLQQDTYTRAPPPIFQRPVTSVALTSIQCAVWVEAKVAAPDVIRPRNAGDQGQTFNNQEVTFWQTTKNFAVSHSRKLTMSPGTDVSKCRLRLPKNNPNHLLTTT